nr:putative cytochrome b5 [Quercus suber]
MSKTFSTSDVASHKSATDLYIIVDEDVYDLTQFQDEHPGGKKSEFGNLQHDDVYDGNRTNQPAVLQRVAGKDASKQFWKYHNESILKKYKGKLQVGSLDTKAKAAPPTPPASPPAAKKEAVVPQAESGAVVPAPGPGAEEEAEAMESFGDLVPYADPSWYQGYHTPYFNESHAALRAEVRQWMEDEIIPNVTEWDEAKKVPDSVYNVASLVTGTKRSGDPSSDTDEHKEKRRRIAPTLVNDGDNLSQPPGSEASTAPQD